MTASVEPSIHRTDPADQLCFVNEVWLGFARDNGTTGLTADSVLGRSLWEFIDGRDVAHLFRIILAEARARQRVLSLPFRCDAPTVRRDMELEVVPLPAGVIEFRSHLRAQAIREPVTLLDAMVARGQWHVPICSWCKHVEVSVGTWEDTDKAVRDLGLLSSATMPRLLHTVCPQCMAAIQGQCSHERPGRPS